MEAARAACQGAHTGNARLRASFHDSGMRLSRPPRITIPRPHPDVGAKDNVPEPIGNAEIPRVIEVMMEQVPALEAIGVGAGRDSSMVRSNCLAGETSNDARRGGTRLIRLCVIGSIECALTGVGRSEATTAPRSDSWLRRAGCRDLSVPSLHGS